MRGLREVRLTMSELVVELYGQRRWTDTHKASTTQLLGRLIYEPCEDAFPLHRCMEWWQIAPGAQELHNLI